MIGALLIANRGEIACRIMRTARRMGVRTIAVYSEADAGAPHCREADMALPIGPSEAAKSYLDGEKIIAAARAAGADAVHPGYGFLSENADFAEAVIAAGLVWVGPPPAAIRAMGLKHAAKALMEAAGVPVTPGYHGEDQSWTRLAEEAKALGYPVLIKAVAGGGGKGLRKVGSAGELFAALGSARREAAGAFGDDRVLIEKYIERPRHIEVQIFADRHGNLVHLFERDCSVQRRHQKVIEEAPAPGLDEPTREAVCAMALGAAKAVKYEGAGTVELIADAAHGLKADRIWFMEMNTRLQVEHPVTEMITGLDLVEWQLRIAAGEALPLPQEKIARSGHAIEARLYAENPAAGFLPSTGTLSHFELPYGVRVDAGLEAGDAVSPFYDPMIAKLIAVAPTRAAAAFRLAEACAAVEAWPVKTNAAFLARTLAHPDFLAGALDTGFIERHLDALTPTAEISAEILTAAAHAFLDLQKGDPASPWTALSGFRLNAPAQDAVALQSGDKVYTARLDADPPFPPHAVALDDAVVVFAAGEAHAFTLPQGDARGTAVSEGDGVIRAPMPGRIAAVLVKAKDKVKKGQTLVVLEAMKMEQGLAAPFDGTVAAVSAEPGAHVVEGESLASLESPAPAKARP